MVCRSPVVPPSLLQGQCHVSLSIGPESHTLGRNLSSKLIRAKLRNMNSFSEVAEYQEHPFSKPHTAYILVIQLKLYILSNIFILFLDLFQKYFALASALFTQLNRLNFSLHCGFFGNSLQKLFWWFSSSRARGVPIAWHSSGNAVVVGINVRALLRRRRR